MFQEARRWVVLIKSTDGGPGGDGGEMVGWCLKVTLGHFSGLSRVGNGTELTADMYICILGEPRIAFDVLSP